jgi:hypothetical protein
MKKNTEITRKYTTVRFSNIWSSFTNASKTSFLKNRGTYDKNKNINEPIITGILESSIFFTLSLLHAKFL